MIDDLFLNKLEKKIERLDDKELKEMIYQLIDSKRKLDDTTKRDYLTGAYNRRILNDIAAYTTVVMCDIDDFKKINDLYGHSMGDDVLRTAVSVIANNIRTTDYLIRYGGDEFLLIFNNCSLETTIKRMDKIQNDLNKDVKLSVSIGISEYNGSKDMNEIIREADLALYKSKTEGKCKIKVFKK